MSNVLAGIYAEQEQKALFSIIIKAVLAPDKTHILHNMNTFVSEIEAIKILEIVDELKQGKPIQYVLGETEFYNCRIKLSPATLIPRQETEELVDIIIKENAGYDGQIVDIGTGSGCIAIALAKNMPDAFVFGTDFSAEAIEIAKQNAEINSVKVEFIWEDIFKPAKILSLNPSIIVSNPPYVRNSEKAFMHRNVLDYEPETALFVDDTNPLIFYEAILEIAAKILQTGGKIYFEINEALGSEMIDLLKKFGYAEIKLIKDINGKERFIKGIKNGI